MTVRVTVPDLELVEVRTRTQDDAGAWCSSRGQVQVNGLGVTRLNRASRRAGLQNRPTQLLAVPSEDGAYIYLIPVKEHPKAVAVSYSQSKASFNLSPLFTYLNYRPQPGSREFHRIEIAEAPVQVEDWEAPALIMHMKVEETRWAKTEGQKKKAEAEKAAKETAKNAAPAKAEG